MSKTPYEVVGEKGISELVNNFYDKVAKDDILSPLYRENLKIPRKILTKYLIERFGGPKVYTEERGNPRLKFRHIPFAIGQKERDRWIKIMRDALEESEINNHTEAKEQMLKYFEKVSTQFINDKNFTIMAK